jgi:hypothetical protein
VLHRQCGNRLLLKLGFLFELVQQLVYIKEQTFIILHDFNWTQIIHIWVKFLE